MKKIEFNKNPSSDDIDFLTRKINDETVEFGSAYPFGIFIRDDDNNLIAGANGFVIYGSIYTDQLWVKKECRGQGYGREIMDKVHEFGKSEGCKIATVQTMDFQNVANFYRKLGYRTDFKRPGYTSGSSCIFMKKDL
ncbi:MAG: hypothetical protein Tsb0021_11530 [Chlamydiales bacterium]